MSAQPPLVIHPSWRAKVEKDGKLALSTGVRFNARTGLTHLRAIEDLAKVRALLLANAEAAITRLTRDRDPKALPGLKKEDRPNP